MAETDTMSGNSTAIMADLLKWKQRAREYKAEVEKLTAAVKERDEKITALEADVDTLSGGFEELEQQLQADPDGLRQRIAELEGEIWTRDTRSKVEAIAKDAKVRPDAMGDLWELLKIQRDPESELTDDAIKERVAEAVKARAYLLQSSPETGDGAAGAAQGRTGAATAGGIAPRPPGPGIGRGAPERTQPMPTVETATAARFAASGRDNPFRIA